MREPVEPDAAIEGADISVADLEGADLGDAFEAIEGFLLGGPPTLTQGEVAEHAGRELGEAYLGVGSGDGETREQRDLPLGKTGVAAPPRPDQGRLRLRAEDPHPQQVRGELEGFDVAARERLGVVGDVGEAELSPQVPREVEGDVGALGHLALGQGGRSAEQERLDRLDGVPETGPLEVGDAEAGPLEVVL